jgi:putative peptide zinc metalloprotease protein
VSTLVDAPVRVDGVQLIGDMVGSGYRTPPALVRRSDGQVLQLTPLLYEVLRAADGRRSCAEIAEAVGQEVGRTLTENDVKALVDGSLRPVGLVQGTDGSEPELQRSNPLLALKAKIAVTDPQTTHRLTAPFRLLFRPLVVAVVLLGFLAVVGWVFFERGLGASAYDAFEKPHLLLLVFVVSVLSGGFHEFGHAAAARYSGAKPGVMGAGLNLVWPAFYTDVTDSYRLGRGGRLRTDLGGLYFNAVVVVLTFVWWWTTGWEALLLLVATQTLQMVQQLLPLLRFDGYHVLADLAGVPDLYHRIKPTLLGLLPHRWRSPENRLLTPWARIVITLWVLVTVPMMTLMLLGMIAAVPRLVGTAGTVVREDAAELAQAWGAWDFLDVASHMLQILGVVLTAMASALVFTRFSMRFFRGMARWAEGSAGKRVVAALATAVVFTLLSWAWWPHPGTYRPIQPGERGLVAAFLPTGATGTADAATAGAADRVTTVPAGTAATQRLSSDEPLVATFDKDSKLPTEKEPQLAVVLVPADGAAPAAQSPAPTVSAAPTPPLPSPSSTPAPAADTWVFPFDQPLPPDEGDNQALAVNTTDSSVVYDVAFALVWAEGDEVLNVNEAHAYASCSDCVTVAVAFQVVLILDDAHVVIPQNLAVAANYDCYSCITAAVASQLVLSVERDPGEEDLRALGAVWDQLLQLGNSITSYSLTEITAKLDDIKRQIVAILDEAPPAASASSEASSTATGSPADASGSPSPDPSGSMSVPPLSGSTTTSQVPTSQDPTTPDQTSATSPVGGDTTPPPPSETATSTPSPSTPTSTEPTAPSGSTTTTDASSSPSGTASP